MQGTAVTSPKGIFPMPVNSLPPVNLARTESFKDGVESIRMG